VDGEGQRRTIPREKSITSDMARWHHHPYSFILSSLNEEDEFLAIVW
jgi:hypothetical protein